MSTLLVDQVNQEFAAAPGSVDGTLVGRNATTPVGFFGAVPIVRPVPAGNAVTVAAGATVGVFTNTSFSGGVGTTAYTIGDLVAVLKAHGLLLA